MWIWQTNSTIQLSNHMKEVYSSLLALAMVSLLFPGLVRAQNEESVLRELISSLLSSYNSCDAAAISDFYDKDSQTFEHFGLLTTFDSQEITEFCSHGGKYDLTFEVIQTRVHNGTGIVLFYNKGSVILPTSDTIDANDRVTTIWIRNAEKWRIVHTHISVIE